MGKFPKFVLALSNNDIKDYENYELLSVENRTTDGITNIWLHIKNRVNFNEYMIEIEGKKPKETIVEISDPQLMEEFLEEVLETPEQELPELDEIPVVLLKVTEPEPKKAVIKKVEPKKVTPKKPVKKAPPKKK